MRFALGKSRRNAPSKRTALLSGFGAVIAWGLTPVATKAATRFLAPLPLLALRMPLSLLSLLPLTISTLRRFERRHMGRLVVVSLLGVVGYNLPITFGLTWLPASTAGILLGTEPIFILAMSMLIDKEAVAPRVVLGGALAIIGTIMVSFIGASRPAADPALGIALVLLATVSFAAYSVGIRPLSTRYGSSASTAVSTSVGSVPYFLLLGTVPYAHIKTFPCEIWALVLFLAFGATSLGLLLWNKAAATIGSVRVGVLLYLEPVVGIVGSVLLLNEKLSPAAILGASFILGGVAVANADRLPNLGAVNMFGRRSR